MTKEAINKRFIYSVDLLISEKKVKSKSVIAKNIQIKPNTLSEILNKRMNIGLDTLALFCEEFNVSANWLLLGKNKSSEASKNKKLKDLSIAEVIDHLLDFPEEELRNNNTWKMFLRMHVYQENDILEIKSELLALKKELAKR